MTLAVAPADPDIRLTARALIPAVLAALAALGIGLLGADTALFLRINSAAARWPDVMWSLITDQASTLSAAALLALSVYHRPRIAAAGLLAWPAGVVLIRGLKWWIDAPRPAASLPADSFHLIGPELTRYSFPSGHTATAFALAAALLYSVDHRTRRRWALPVALAAALVGVSRIAVGAHWPVDVLGGAALGWLCGLTGAAWAARWPLWQQRGGYLTLIALAAGAGALRVALDSGYGDARPLAIALGLAAVAMALACALREVRR
ncbi:MAG: phosphatase PAP2 family protein [Rhodocyclaceae bacterium]|nr:phosphatase PAP2 family protein [Rhodocyclaceae bacterium]